MNLNITQGDLSQVNLAFYIANVSQLDKTIFSPEEFEFVSNKIESSPDNWICINQYSRLIYIYRYKKHVPGNHLFLESSRKAGANLGEALNKEKQENVAINAFGHDLLLAEGLLLGNYKYLKYLSDKEKNTPSLQNASFSNCSKEELQEVINLGESVMFSRDLVNTPVIDLNPTDLANEAKRSSKANGFKVEVFDKKKIESLKMAGLLAVNAGSIDPPAFIIMEHKPENAKNEKPIILVGKGVVYDTGGLSLKPSNFMDTMKSDMGGAAAVIGTMQAIASNNINKHVIGLVPSTDNRPGGNAVTPDDVITYANGKSVEIKNTDAEGRLILADALIYAQKYDPELVIDLATLTGAAAYAIGKYGIVAMGDAEDNAWNKLKTSGKNSYERIVEFPFWEEYDELLKSDIADLKNLGPRDAGAITAGKFLSNFTDYPYIHLDIAGPAFVDANDGYIKKGGTGVGVRLLYDFLKNY
ncbi:MAG: leucyl aminopeptidase [Schleiferiaceae bacterium]|jgi:leucyl aminopeptidase|nr:leucyl aminopeptidase [Schleiferiaceae bacterium]